MPYIVVSSGTGKKNEYYCTKAGGGIYAHGDWVDMQVCGAQEKPWIRVTLVMGQKPEKGIHV